jgi:trans-aconitate 2-methyltransferase
MSGWDPGQYLKFADHRLRPALDLLARVPLEGCGTAWDLGCGAGNVTALIKARWPKAAVTGVDSSAEMLAKARATAGIDWVQSDLASWRATAPADLVFSNAALHWLPDHARLFAHLIHQVAKGGVLAVQMPRNFAAPSHALLREVARDGAWAPRLAAHLMEAPVAPPPAYFDWLAPHAASLDIWEQEYLQILEGENPVVEWTKGTVVKPMLDQLTPEERPVFLSSYAKKIAQAYPRRGDGKTLFAFRRLFIVARR